MAVSFTNFPTYIQQIINTQTTILLRLESIMTTGADLTAALAAVQAAVTNAVALIEMLHQNQTVGGSVSDADVESAVTALNAAAASLAAAKPLP